RVRRGVGIDDLRKCSRDCLTLPGRVYSQNFAGTSRQVGRGDGDNKSVVARRAAQVRGAPGGAHTGRGHNGESFVRIADRTPNTAGDGTSGRSAEVTR